mmetsp:Transcript_27807/g.55686  ORF Transcript_27807/g.55686 Transcript_27807/m.55686 type:complete len:654 (+) Transcript_27807:171-2132(+)|eukprot:CAMPEP_0194339932 /NCGR_PEP_ID=MMETSP0171-20130528/84836_1 /TAXON_ID=218684 /ORGANISM="Corethron pennatum, Strain L29A3" /LENGTH=653 /DNA_ID=CAMNT_0039104701 /DNA_START=109 /DNA_END=2070 /DNA_ORIENTATION=-
MPSLPKNFLTTKGSFSAIDYEEHDLNPDQSLENSLRASYVEVPSVMEQVAVVDNPDGSRRKLDDSRRKNFSSNPSYTTLYEAVSNFSGGARASPEFGSRGWGNYNLQSHSDLDRGFLPLKKTYSMPHRSSQNSLFYEDGDFSSDRALSNANVSSAVVKDASDAANDAMQDSAVSRHETDYKDGPQEVPIDEKTPLSMSITYGIVNAAILLPIMMSFGNIIYRDAFFTPYLPTLIKLTVLSSFVHQMIFSTFSGLPFAIGQVQDAGLIFLSAMASSIIKKCKDQGCDDASILATVTIGLSVCTFILGCGLIIIGRLELAGYIEYIPMPVISGYLAYIGFFCGQSGLSIMGNVEVHWIFDWWKFVEFDAFIHLLPGLVGGCGIYIAIGNIRHLSVLPSCMVFILVAFYAVLFFADIPIAIARENKWLNDLQEQIPLNETWAFLDFRKVVWGALPSQTFALLSMIVVVALSSSLDVAAIGLELGHPLDYNHELKTVGFSNVISGLTGGYTGSYIFSQSIMILRAGIRSRVAGYVVAVIELASVLLPFPIIAYIPKFFFGSLLVMIAVDLLHEWLWAVRLKVSRLDYIIALCTFVLLLLVRVQFGILGGCVIHVIVTRCTQGNLENNECDALLQDTNGNNSLNYDATHEQNYTGMMT